MLLHALSGLTALNAFASGLASAVVYLVHPASEPSPDQLEVLWGPLAAGRHVLVAINGPSRVKGLAAAAAAGAPAPAATLSTEDAQGESGTLHLSSSYAMCSTACQPAL